MFVVVITWVRVSDIMKTKVKLILLLHFWPEQDPEHSILEIPKHSNVLKLFCNEDHISVSVLMYFYKF